MGTVSINIRYKLGIIGVGAVGAPVKRHLEDHRGFVRGENIFYYDIDKEKGFDDDVNLADIIFLCVSTPSKVCGACDLSSVISSLKMIKKNKVVVLKSTVPPGTTESLQKERKDLKMLFNPEFLTEKQAWEDFIRPDRQIVGFTDRSFDVAQVVLSIPPKAPFMSPWGIHTYKTIRISATEAEIIKYASNVWFLRKVNLANAVGRLCERLSSGNGSKVLYEHVRRGLSADHRIGDSHLDIEHNGYRGWGGRCFSKDLLAIISHCKELGLHDCASLFESDLDFNVELLDLQGLSLENVSGNLKYNHKRKGRGS